MTDIKTWSERCEVHPEHQSGMVSHAMIQMRMQEEIDDLRAENERLRETADSAYTERNRLVALVARLFPSGLAKTAIPGWDEAWHGCVYVDLPTGQASWHYHDREAHLFDGLPHYHGEWDGHSTEEKYDRVARAALKGDSNE